ncbi:MAG: hypothetical protein IKJ19_01905 [Clostridia bacterium]|nr:hypothetical protein [Clostridia bacterium]
MNKNIIKTAIKTLVVLLVITGIIYGGFALFAPQKLVSFYKDIGENETALKFQERVYQKEKSLESLLGVINLAIADEDEDKIIYYADKLITNYEVEKDLEENYCDFVIFNYCVALYDEERMDDAIDIAAHYSVAYQTTDPIRRLAAYSVDENDITFAYKVRLAITQIDTSALSSESQALLQNDIIHLNEFLGL